jgi:lactate dehydrogenase-like 2-hydroxyacid dehydrogenase
VCNKVPIRHDAIERLPDLNMICIPPTGHDAFDIEACQKRGIVVSNVQGYAVITVAEHTFALILALRRAAGASQSNRRGSTTAFSSGTPLPGSQLPVNLFCGDIWDQERSSPVEGLPHQDVLAIQPQSLEHRGQR